MSTVFNSQWWWQPWFIRKMRFFLQDSSFVQWTTLIIMMSSFYISSTNWEKLMFENLILPSHGVPCRVWVIHQMYHRRQWKSEAPEQLSPELVIHKAESSWFQISGFERPVITDQGVQGSGLGPQLTQGQVDPRGVWGLLGLTEQALSIIFGDDFQLCGTRLAWTISNHCLQNTFWIWTRFTVSHHSNAMPIQNASNNPLIAMWANTLKTMRSKHCAGSLLLEAMSTGRLDTEGHREQTRNISLDSFFTASIKLRLFSCRIKSSVFHRFESLDSFLSADIYNFSHCRRHVLLNLGVHQWQKLSEGLLIQSGSDSIQSMRVWCQILILDLIQFLRISDLLHKVETCGCWQSWANCK